MVKKGESREIQGGGGGGGGKLDKYLNEDESVHSGTNVILYSRLKII